MVAIAWLATLILKICVGPSCTLNSDAIIDQLKVSAQGRYIVETVQCLNACKRPCNVAVFKQRDRWENGTLVKEYPLNIPGFNSYECTKNCFSGINKPADIDRILGLLNDYIK